MEHTVNTIDVINKAAVIKADINALLSSGNDYIVSFHNEDYEIEDNDNIVIVKGEYGVTSSLIVEQIRDYENLEHSNEFDIEEYVNYKIMIIHPVENEEGDEEESV